MSDIENHVTVSIVVIMLLTDFFLGRIGWGNQNYDYTFKSVILNFKDHKVLRENIKIIIIHLKKSRELNFYSLDIENIPNRQVYGI